MAKIAEAFVEVRARLDKLKSGLRNAVAATATASGRMTKQFDVLASKVDNVGVAADRSKRRLKGLLRSQQTRRFGGFEFGGGAALGIGTAFAAHRASERLAEAIDKLADSADLLKDAVSGRRTARLSRLQIGSELQSLIGGINPAQTTAIRRLSELLLGDPIKKERERLETEIGRPPRETFDELVPRAEKLRDFAKQIERGIRLLTAQNKAQRILLEREFELNDFLDQLSKLSTATGISARALEELEARGRTLIELQTNEALKALQDLRKLDGAVGVIDTATGAFKTGQQRPVQKQDIEDQTKTLARGLREITEAVAGSAFGEAFTFG